MAGTTRRRRFIGLTILAILVLIGMIYAFAIGTTVEQGLDLSKRGTVLDAAAAKPVAGAYVVATWHQEITDPFLIGHGGSAAGGCVHRIVTRTDSDGRYSIPSPSGAFAVDRNFRPDKRVRYYWRLYAYAVGYGPPEQKIGDELRPVLANHPNHASSLSVDEIVPIYLEHDNSPPQSRIDDLKHALWEFTCTPEIAAERELAKSIYQEAYQAACVPKANAAAVSLVELRSTVASAIGSLSPAVEAEAETIARQNGRMAQKPASEEDVQRLCSLLGPPTEKEHQ
jgi:hypothetical protein